MQDNFGTDTSTASNAQPTSFEELNSFDWNKSASTENGEEASNETTGREEIPAVESNLNETEEHNSPDTASKSYVPFSNGAEKIKVNGKEIEVESWTEAKRLMSLGQAGYERMQQASEVNKQYKELQTTYNNHVAETKELEKQLREFAISSPQELLKALAPDYYNSRTASVVGRQSEGEQERQEGITPQDAQILRMAQQIESLSARDGERQKEFETYRRAIESESLEKTKMQISQELQEIRTDFPLLQDRYIFDGMLRDFEKDYEREKENGTDPKDIISLSDYAYLYEKQVKRQRQEESVKKLQAERRIKPATLRGVRDSDAEYVPSFEDYKARGLL